MLALAYFIIVILGVSETSTCYPTIEIVNDKSNT